MEQGKSNNSRRSPIIVVMGHVDHGKTSLLDYIRKANVASREAGGITQSIGAYEIEHNGRKMTFIDTPGHEAFTNMRSRGAAAADLAILVVAVDEGVKPQTKEAIQILKKSETPFVVAITKIDKNGDLSKVKNDLANNEVLLEGYGGNISFHGVSAKTGDGVNDLLDLLLLAADLEDLNFNPSAPAAGFVLEVKRDARRGIEAAIIVKNGTLKRGSEMHTPSAKGKVKILEDFTGKAIDAITPSSPALVIGFESLPKVGELFSAEPVAEVAPKVQAPRAPQSALAKNKETLNLILKAADAGSLEVLSSIISAMATPEKPLKIVDESVGDITDGDVKTAVATGAVIIGFKNKADKGARNLAEPHEIKIITSEIVYDLVKAVQDFLADLGKPKTIGELEILAVFNVKKTAEQLVGGRVTSGIVRNKAAFEVMRGGSEKPSTSGRVMNLREKKSEITQAETGKEIGLMVTAGSEIQVGDKLIIHK